jgi:hypothetical protein
LDHAASEYIAKTIEWLCSRKNVGYVALQPHRTFAVVWIGLANAISPMWRLLCISNWLPGDNCLVLPSCNLIANILAQQDPSKKKQDPADALQQDHEKFRISAVRLGLKLWHDTKPGNPMQSILTSLSM